ncbi:MAG: YggS family pyridoxal phosphate-dependent enzyme [Betaproteobacteria bacterium]
MTTIGDNLERVLRRIETACIAAGREPREVGLLAVSKSHSAEALAQALAAGQYAFGENYLQEALNKMALLQRQPIQWHCIGPVQSNKTRAVAEHFAWVHSVDRLRTAQRLSEQRPAHMADLQVCIQVNTDAGANKGGVMPQEALALARQVALLPRLKLRGLMSIPEPAQDFAAACTAHMKTKALFDVLRNHGLALDTLSMGMSDDLEAAIASGSTLVRVGSAIFGARAPRPAPA